MPALPHSPPDNALWFLALGGAGEIGMNLGLYGTGGKWLMVDCGITFPDDTTPGIEIIMPDISFITERRADLVGLVVTHGHEDHLGAIEYLWPQLKCPIYTTAFTAALIRAKWADSHRNERLNLREIAAGQKVALAPFQFEMIPVTHSIPESHMLAISTAQGQIVHTGDWKLDPDPVIGELSDTKRLAEIGDEGVAAVVGDSTTAHVPGHSGSERDAQNALLRLFPRFRNRIVITCFASNIARIKSIAIAARASGRKVALVGRSLERNTEIANSLGYLPEAASFIDAEEAARLPRHMVVMIATGCQGETRAALPRIASGTHRIVKLDPDDAVVFSSRDIPGNEKAIARVQNLLLRHGIEIVTRAHDASIHVSGHPAREEIIQLYQWLRPKLVVPVHGEIRHQHEHARIAESCQARVIVPANGQIVRLAPDPEIVADVPSGRLGLDGIVLRKLDRDTLKRRLRIGSSGAVVVTIALDKSNRIVGEPGVTLLGVEDSGNADTAALRRLIVDALHRSVGQLSNRSRENEQAIRQAIVSATRRLIDDELGKEPLVEATIMRV